MNYYMLLGVPRLADLDTIRRAYRALARQYHPDVGEGSSAQKFRDIVEAYETLTDPARRRVYDATLDAAARTARAWPEPIGRPSVLEPLIPERPDPRTTTTNAPGRESRWNVVDPVDALFELLARAFWRDF